MNIGPRSAHPYAVPSQSTNAQQSSSSSSAPVESSQLAWSGATAMPEYKQRLAERVPPELLGFIQRHGARRVDKKEPAIATKIEMPEASYFLQMNGSRVCGADVGKKVLGQGEDGKVREGLRDDGTEVAVKKFNGDPFQAMENAENEFAVSQALGEGKHFTKAFDVAHTEKGDSIKSYIFYELLKGATIKEYCDDLIARIQAGEVGSAQACGEVREMVHGAVETVADMHEAGIVHRDVGEHNLFREESGNIKAIDLKKGEVVSDEIKGTHNEAQQKMGDLAGLFKAMRKLESVLHASGTEQAREKLKQLRELERQVIQFDTLDDEVSLYDLLKTPYFKP